AHAQLTRNQGLGNSESENAAPMQVTVVRPTITDLRRTTTQPAHVEPFERTEMFAKASGFVASVNVDIGDAVKKDQVLAELWIPEMEQELHRKTALLEEAQASVGQASANITAAEAMVVAAEAKLQEAEAGIRQFDAEVAFRRSETTRFAELVKNKAVEAALLDEKLKMLESAESSLASARASVNSSKANIKVEQARLQQARAGLVYSEARLKVAHADLQQTETLVSYAKVRAPYNGMVTRRQVNTGDFVASAVGSRSESLFTVVRMAKPRIVADIPEAESSLIHEGQPAVLVVDALKGRKIEGRVKRTTGVLDSKTRTLRIEVELDSYVPELRPGMFGTLMITLADRPESVTLPARCVRYEGQESFVLCVVDGVVEKRPVKTGHSDGIRVEILEGLRSGDLVVAESASQIRPGQPVVVVSER
ncbi:MAG: efflux RND transporter periplasmic adaptor subunit, partial [Planctomycetaceae bacterium]